MRKLVVALVIVMAVLHQDFWNWDNASLVFGFLPVGLAYHAAYSLLVAALWFFSIRVAWPSRLETWANEGTPGSDENKSCS